MEINAIQKIDKMDELDIFFYVLLQEDWVSFQNNFMQGKILEEIPCDVLLESEFMTEIYYEIFHSKNKKRTIEKLSKIYNCSSETIQHVYSYVADILWNLQ